LEGYKHVEDVVSAMRHLDESYVLRIVGEGPDDKRLRRHVTSLGLQSRVEFLGRVDRACLCRWYRTAAVYVNVSTREAFGIGALEALASGATLVLSDIPAHREMLSKYAGGRGCVARHPDIPAHLADAIKASVCDRRDAVSAPLLPSWDSVSEETGDLYVSVIGRRQRQARR
jgi:Glycosyltransferase